MVFDETPSRIVAIALVVGCSSGANEARRDIHREHLELRIYGMPRRSDPAYAQLLNDQLGVQFSRVAGCVVSDQMVRNVDAYNDIMTAEIERRFGRDILARLEAEARERTPTTPASQKSQNSN